MLLIEQSMVYILAMGLGVFTVLRMQASGSVSLTLDKHPWFSWVILGLTALGTLLPMWLFVNPSYVSSATWALLPKFAMGFSYSCVFFMVGFVSTLFMTSKKKMSKEPLSSMS